jgi:hypothetical protein
MRLLHAVRMLLNCCMTELLLHTMQIMAELPTPCVILRHTHTCPHTHIYLDLETMLNEEDAGQKKMVAALDEEKHKREERMQRRLEQREQRRKAKLPASPSKEGLRS